MEQKFYICDKCGKMVAIVKDTQAHLMCCGQPMRELIPGTSDASVEKHLPVVEIVDNEVRVTVGSVKHPMTPEHYIEWISIQTNNGNQRKMLTPNQEPSCCFKICSNTEVEAVYAYCNLHSLLKTTK